MKLVIERPDPDDGGSVTLTLKHGSVPPELLDAFIRLWKFPTKKEPFEMPNGTREIPTSDLQEPMTLWV